MDETPPRQGDSGVSPDAPALRPLTILADVDESAADALEDWSRGLDWVQWLFSSIRQRQQGIYFHAGELPQQSLYPDARLSRPALAARWENFTRQELLHHLGQPLVQAWQAVQEQDLARLLQLDASLDTVLPSAISEASREAGGRLLQGTRGARYQGILGRYRSEKEAGKTPGHFFIVWAAVGHFFQLSLASVIAEYIRLEWDLAAQSLPGAVPAISTDAIAALTGQLMNAPAYELTLLQSIAK